MEDTFAFAKRYFIDYMGGWNDDFHSKLSPDEIMDLVIDYIRDGTYYVGYEAGLEFDSDAGYEAGYNIGYDAGYDAGADASYDVGADA